MQMDNWSRVKDLFHAALERPPGERATFLDASCGGDSELRREIERLLAAHAASGAFIERSPLTLAGRMLGHYRIERLIGAGGMGAVYLAQDLELGRPVAIKIAHGTDGDAQARLKREAQHVSQLNHPNICTIYEVGAVDGQPFIVMEWVEGRCLADAIPAGGLPEADVASCGAQVAGALAHAHAHGVIHRDLKSTNVMLTPDGRVKVLDFGLARRHSAERLKDLSRSEESLPEQELAAGTLACMAPEILRGGSAGESSDIWSLGVLLYEMACGKRPFAGATGFALSGAILHEPPAPLPDSLRPSIRATVVRCLEKEPAARYGRADDVRMALEETPSRSTQPARDGAAAPRAAAARPALLSRSWRYGIALLLAAALAYGSYRVMRRDDVPVAVGASGRRAIAVLQFENAGGQEADWLSKGVPDMLLTGLAQTRGLEVVSTRRLRQAAKQQGADDLASLEESAAVDVARRAGAGAIVTGNIYKAGAEIRIDARVEDLASGRILAAQSVTGSDVFALVDRLSAGIRGGVGLPDDPQIRHVADVSSRSLDAFRLFSQGTEAFVNARADDARAALEEAVRIDPAFAEAYLQLASVAAFSGQPARRREYLEKAAQHADRLGEARRLFLNIQRSREAGHTAEAARLIDELVAKFPETEAVYTTAGNLYGGELRDEDTLLRLMRTGVAALPASPSVRNDYGYALLETGDYAAGIREFEKYVALAPGEANPYDSLADGYLTSGSAEKAVESYSRAITIDPAFSGSRIGLAWSLAVAGRYDEALAAKPPLASAEAHLVSRLGRYKEAWRLLDAGRQQAGRNHNPLDEAVHAFMSAALALERRDHARAFRELSSAEASIATGNSFRHIRHRVLLHLLTGLAELAAGRRDAARARLPLVRQLYKSDVAEEKYWYQTLVGEIALADGELEHASAAFADGEPLHRKPMRWQSGTATILFNSFPFRDGAARTAKARRDLTGAIRMYRRLLTYDAQSTFIGAFEPRYVLELARLLDETGDTRQALQEYERFLNLWKHADPGLPELAEARRAVTRLTQAAHRPLQRLL
jgi:serine/threonine-protein kinase